MSTSWKRCALPAIAMLLTASGCRTYEPAPLDLEEHRQEWLSRSLADLEGLREYADRLAAASPTGAAQPSAFDSADGLTLYEGEVVALFFNPDLRVARAEANVPLVGARNAGLWEDPVLDVDAGRIIESVSKPWLLGGFFGFTVPLSGRIPVERDLAWAGYETAWRHVAVAEWETLDELRAAWFAWSMGLERLDLLRAYLAELEGILGTAEQLAASGELNPTDARVFRIERASRRAELLGDEAAVEQMRLSLLALLGLSPQANVRLIPALQPSPPAMASGDAPPSLLEHPQLQLAVAAYEVAEQELRSQITKQFPDLTIGPAYENEDGQSRIGLGLGIPVPILNRNRQGIAQAEAARDAARARAEMTYDDLVHLLASVRRRLAATETVRRELEADLAPLVAEQIREIQQLAGLGELNVLLLQDALSSSLEGKLTVLDTHLDEAIARSELDSLLHPRWVFQPESRTQDDEEETTDE